MRCVLPFSACFGGHKIIATARTFTLCSEFHAMLSALCAMPMPFNSQIPSLYSLMFSCIDQRLGDEHRVPIAVKPIPAVDGLLIGIQDFPAAGKGRYQH